MRVVTQFPGLLGVGTLCEAFNLHKTLFHILIKSSKIRKSELFLHKLMIKLSLITWNPAGQSHTPGELQNPDTRYV